LPSDGYRFYVLNTLSEMLAESTKERRIEMFEHRKEQIAENAMSDLNDFIREFKQDADYKKMSLVYSYLAVLPYIDLSEITDEFTNKVFTIDSLEFMHTSALAARISANLPVDLRRVEAEIDSLDTRYEILLAYYRSGKLEEVHPRYRAHDEFAKLLLHNYLTDYYDNPLSIQLLGDIKKGEDTYYAFEFSYEEDGLRKDYLGISGAFDNQADKLDFERCAAFTEFGLKNADWMSQAEALISKMEDNE